MTLRHPLIYELAPQRVEEGRRWLTVTLKNVGDHDLAGLDIQLNALDAYSISVYGTGSYAPRLEVGEERAFPFQFLANASARLYISADGWLRGEAFHWETPGILVTVGEPVAELVSLFTLTPPYLRPHETVQCEVTLEGVTRGTGLTLQMWIDAPDDTFEKLADIETKPLEVGERARYMAEFTPRTEGLYTVYAYLYAGHRRIGRELEHVYVTEGEG
jgi:hypothetical protein